MKWNKCLWDTDKMWHCLIREDCSTCPFYKKELEMKKKNQVGKGIWMIDITEIKKSVENSLKKMDELIENLCYNRKRF